MACPPMPFCLSISTLHVCQKANSSVHRQVKSRTGSYRSPPLLHPHALCLGAFQSSRLLGLKSKFKGRGLTLQAAVPALPNIGHSFEEQIALFCGHEDCWAGESTLSAPLPDALSRTFPERFPTMTAARKACRKKLVYIDGGSGWQQGLCGSPVSLGTKIIVFPRDAASALRGEARESTRLMVVYEDDHMAVVVKPPGYAVHGRGRKTVKHILGGELLIAGWYSAGHGPLKRHCHAVREIPPPFCLCRQLEGDKRARGRSSQASPCAQAGQPHWRSVGLRKDNGSRCEP